jgi:hypothetical protein
MSTIDDAIRRIEAAKQDDSGPLNMQMKVVDGTKLVCQFNRSVSWISWTADEARRFATMLNQGADLIDPPTVAGTGTVPNLNS